MIEAMTPREIVATLDEHIVGQANAKRAVAIAMRNRWRRAKVEGDLRAEITPKNILMIGPTGVGKTEIARRLAKLSDAPFIKVEATKFTEVGYVGKDVDTIVRDLVDVAVKEARDAALKQARSLAQDAAEDRVLDALVGTHAGEDSATRQTFRKRLREGTLDEREIEIDVAQTAPQVDIMAPPGMEAMSEQLRGLFAGLQSGKTQSRKLTVREALRALTEEEAAKRINEEDLRERAVAAAEQNGIVFIDEIDKVASRGGGAQGSAEVSRQGVQRDLLPLVEGTTVQTKYGMVRTDHMLFIASGAFHLAKPSDLIPELQGRFPIRVELASLSVDDFVAILSGTQANLIRQYQALLATEGVKLEIDEAAIRQLAQTAFEVNERTENIGARRLATVMERLLDDLSFTAPDRSGETVTIRAEDVRAKLSELARNEDLSRYIL